ncbi:hypothetical protein [Terriglobus roseus]|uniref:Uncharacterized protein n=1 Tax=Terriglobus roseus TaxID=392734 RepID=A0A1H4LYR8_9BACT|nr:hypothetical protein [Terriglobus roseus]SEB75863.1 hypothetical protein SAMN05443244_1761 [Terriglobus roseus]
MTMRLSTLLAGSLITALSAHAADGAMPAPPRSACRATLSAGDARSLAAATPNARAFEQNLHASISTAVARASASSVSVRVTAQMPERGTQEVGLYSVNLHSGHVVDDDQEPAEDHETAVVRERLMAKHCH